ncbi:phenylalanine--tRNA ligase subunit beta [Alkalihalobacterium bogoriense]|uniref:phenylalanine--tRNA ligase subunit beta n=1 Tax=Alkalihalobacterium bogoriense TaxID=246272 RepID=UPI00047CACFB|nr:phenylalanine--tRNA ligase subunit beta [Alkalihalobacterium bogoriense]
MLVSYRWLQEYIDLTNITPQEIAERLTRGGVEVDIIHKLNKGISGVVIGHVLDCKQHPNADKLNVCQVDIGEEEHVQIVCGARNVGSGQKVAVAKVGAVLPDNFKIKKAKLRGEVSQGMICSLQELGIEGKLVQKEYSEGIFVFPNDVTVGEDALSQLNLYDEVLELDLTPNRADCLSMIGVAYEVAALLDRDVTFKDPQYTPSTEKAADYIKVQVEAKEDNPYYGAKIIKGVKIGPSPLWLQNRLVASGIRPISNVVDVTNFVLLEYGQPLHAFDYDRLGSKEILVRRANKNEQIVTLDDEQRTLSPDHLVITNGEDPVAVAGVMGGAFSEVQSDTTTILLEAAYFKNTTVRKGSKDLGIRSEASVRYEKGVDPQRVEKAAERACELIVQVAGGEVLDGIVEVNHLQIQETEIDISVDQINERLGTAITSEEVAAILERLRFSYTQKDKQFIVTAPTRRQDISIQEDLMEEVARIYGYDYIPTTLPKGLTTPGTLSDYQKKRRIVRRFLESCGLNQTITYSLTSPSKAKGLDGEMSDVTPVQLAMPMSEDRSTMRTTLLPHLLDVITYNKNRKVEDVFLYEVGSIFLSDENVVTKQPVEQEMVAAAFTGLWHNHSWQGEKKAVDFFVVKGVVEGLCKELGIAPYISFSKGEQAGLHPGRTAFVYLNEKPVGVIGQLHPQMQKSLDLSPTYVFQLHLEALLTYETKELRYTTIPRYPSMTRDIALVVDESLEADKVRQVIEKTGTSLLDHVRLFDLYQGEHLEEGKKSLAFSLTYLDPERTLTEEEVTTVHQNVLTALEQELGATLRS